MFNDLENSFFEVVLIPAPDPQHSEHKVRAVQYANPLWYSKLCGLYTSTRGKGRKRMKRPRTIINRSNTFRALNAMIDGRDAGIYGDRLAGLVEFELSRRRVKRGRIKDAGNLDDCPF